VTSFRRKIHVFSFIYAVITFFLALFVSTRTRSGISCCDTMFSSSLASHCPCMGSVFICQHRKMFWNSADVRGCFRSLLQLSRSLICTMNFNIVEDGAIQLHHTALDRLNKWFLTMLASFVFPDCITTDA
jgi:hypothetical protein